jgi:flagellar hook-associated protein 2
MATDHAGILSKVQNFVDKYNAVMTNMNTQLSYDSTNQTKGTLFGNSTLMAMQNQLRSFVTGNVPGMNPSDPNTLSSLAQVGIKNDVNNTLTLDGSVFNAALTKNFDQVTNLFASTGKGSYSFVSASGFTQGGQYDTKVEGGILKMRLSGSAGNWISLIQDGNFTSGATNTPLDGLLLRTGPLTEGQTGSMTITAGVGTRVQAYTTRYSEFSTEGLIYNQNKSLETRDKEFLDQMTTLTARLAVTENNLKAKFTNLETLLSKMSSQQNYLNQQLSGINPTTGKKFI